ncbi:hypothetical protein [Prauserella cavernicola]|uniref:Uncharacterized protein n=1 Tax=Prauserella cavernicola TaxID=2800127 RepID=A0A934V810_9PSEU|nr:hypothetical protein [Prauserella cavernicola]MBK1787258.1 hypothetical protein [Prauserella cavernicola]
MSAIEVFANSKADHGLAPLTSSPTYVPVLCTELTSATCTILAATTTNYFGGVTHTAALIGDVPSAGIPAHGSAGELLRIRSGSIG